MNNVPLHVSKNDEVRDGSYQEAADFFYYSKLHQNIQMISQKTATLCVE